MILFNTAFYSIISRGNHENNSPEDAGMRPPRFLFLILGGILFKGTIRLCQVGGL